MLEDECVSKKKYKLKNDIPKKCNKKCNNRI